MYIYKYIFYNSYNYFVLIVSLPKILLSRFVANTCNFTLKCFKF